MPFYNCIYWSLDTSEMAAKRVTSLIAVIVFLLSCANASPDAEPRPPVWPETFHALAVQNRNGSLALVDLYYEWGRGRNANLIHKQMATTLYDIE